MKTEQKHTPGPWKVRGAVKGFRVVFGDLGDIAQMIGKRFSDHELQANAELIARAPSLLAENEALRQQNAEFVAILQWWQDQMHNDACDDMGNLLDMMTGKVSAILATVQS